MTVFASVGGWGAAPTQGAGEPRAAEGAGGADSVGATGGRARDAGTALRFRPGEPELVVLSPAALSHDELTIELWAKADGVPAQHAQLLRRLNHWEKPGWLLAVSQSGYPAMQVRWFDGVLCTLPDSLLGTWYRGGWHHFATVLATDSVRMYVNGVLVSERAREKAGPLLHDQEAPLRIGAEGFVGEIDEVRIWSNVRTAAQIRDNVYRSMPSGEPGLVAYWRFDRGSTADLSASRLAFQGEPDLSGRLVESGAPIASASKLRDHRAVQAKIAAGRAEVEQVARRLPELNARIYRFATSLAGETFGSGDCWNFVMRAMDMAGARRPDVYVFGRPVPREQALPGDLVQFENFTSPSFGSQRHSAVLWRNHGDGRIAVIHQNGPPNGAAAGVWEIDLRGATGQVTFFRPER